jgi:hypothetical protein
MRPRGVTGLTEGMTTDQPPRRGSSFVWVLFISGLVVLGFLLVLPWIATALAVALFGLGGSGSNK